MVGFVSLAYTEILPPLNWKLCTQNLPRLLTIFALKSAPSSFLLHFRANIALNIEFDKRLHEKYKLYHNFNVHIQMSHQYNYLLLTSCISCQHFVLYNPHPSYVYDSFINTRWVPYYAFDDCCSCQTTFMQR